MKNRTKIIISYYNCFCALILIISLILAFKINRDIFSQQKILKKQKLELDYVTNLNNKMVFYESNFKILQEKAKESDELSAEIDSLLNQEYELDNLINDLNTINKNLEDKISIYE